jgi:hypothetical protein
MRDDRPAMTDVSRYEQLGEAAYEAMYDAQDRYAVKPHYEDACDRRRRASGLAG